MLCLSTRSAGGFVGELPADADGYDALARAIGDPGDSWSRRGGHGVLRGRAGEEAGGLGYNVVEVLRPKRDRLMVGADKNDPEDAERAARKAASARVLRPKGAGRLGRGAEAGLRGPQAAREDHDGMRGLREVAAHDRPRAREGEVPPRERRRRAHGGARLRGARRDGGRGGGAGLAEVARPRMAGGQETGGGLRCACAPHRGERAGPPRRRVRGHHLRRALAVTAGDNPDRMGGEASFAAVCGVSPVEASSGKVKRHRLNRGGNRQANWALWQIVKARMASDERTKAYVERRTREGKSKREIMRCLKRYVAREVYKVLLDPNPDGAPPHGDGLRRMRRARRVTQREVAEALGVSVTTIANLEHGRARSTRLESGYYAFLTS